MVSSNIILIVFFIRKVEIIENTYMVSASSSWHRALKTLVISQGTTALGVSFVEYLLFYCLVFDTSSWHRTSESLGTSWVMAVSFVPFFPWPLTTQHVPYGILASQPGIEPGPTAVNTWSPIHGPAKEVLHCLLF